MWCGRLLRLTGLLPPLAGVRRLAGSAAPQSAHPDGGGRLPRSVAGRHRELRRRPRLILDMHEEQRLADRGETPPLEEPLWDPVDAWSAQRGRTGVFDVQELVQVLTEEGMEDVCVLRMPEEHAYVGHMVLATARSHQHMLATAQFLKKLYKRKRLPADPVPRIEGRSSREWIAMDMVNIALHLFDNRAREHYDVDGLWAVGPRYDDLSQQQEEHDLLDLNPLSEFAPNPPKLEVGYNDK